MMAEHIDQLPGIEVTPQHCGQKGEPLIVSLPIRQWNEVVQALWLLHDQNKRLREYMLRISKSMAVLLDEAEPLFSKPKDTAWKQVKGGTSGD